MKDTAKRRHCTISVRVPRYQSESQLYSVRVTNGQVQHREGKEESELWRGGRAGAGARAALLVPALCMSCVYVLYNKLELLGYK